VLRQDIGHLNFWLNESQWRSHEGILQWTVLLLAFIVFAIWETFRPHKAPGASAGRRWTHHAILSFLINSPLAWLSPISAVAAAVAVSHSPYGLLNRVSFSTSARYVLAILLLDLARYGQHRLYHSIPALWRIHRVHHADPDCDWSTSLLFHPGEVILSQASYLAVVALLAPPPLAVLGLEIISILQTVFEHANIEIPERIDAFLRRFLITPDLHRIHHSDRTSEQNTNFGTVFSWWDFCFKRICGSLPQGNRCVSSWPRCISDSLRQTISPLTSIEK
jgi:sterol desaturase/sphingolipid hydroxylase (fatty acid hydroxylase superfamily)